MRGRAVLQRIQQEAELDLGVFRRDLQRAEHLALHFGTVDTDGAATQFPAVQHHVVGLGHALGRVAVHVVLVTILGRGEGVVHGVPAVLVLVVFEHREVDHPQRRPAVLEQAVLLAELAVAHLQAQCADGVVDDLGLVGTEEDQVAVLGAGALQNHVQGGIVQVLDDRTLQAFAALGLLVDLDPGQALGAIDLDELGVAVDLAAAHLAALRHAQRHYAATRSGCRRGEHLEVHILHHVGEFGELQLDAQVGLVGTVQVHGVGILHDRELAQIHVHGVAEHLLDHVLEQRADLVFAQEGGLDVDLREFGLAVGAQVFVAEALGDLVVAVVAGHHQQLLEQLGRLRQRKEVAIVHAAGHQVVTRAFGRALGQHRRFDVDEAVGVEELAHFHRHLVAQHQIALHVGAAQVQHAMRQTGGFAQVVVIELERGRDGGVQHVQFVAEHLDLAGGDIVVGGAFGACAHQALDLHAELVAQVFGHLEHLGAVRIADHLHIAFAVAQVDEDHATVVATAVDPAAQGYSLAQQGFGHLTAIDRTHCHFFSVFLVPQTARDMLDVNRSFQDLRAAPGERAQRGVQQPAKACLQSRPCATDRPRARAAPPHPWK